MAEPAPPLDVFGLGQCAYDHLMLVPGFPGAHEKVEGHGLLRQCGGPVATALWALSRWGRSCAFVGVVGDDEAGARIREDLKAAGIDESGLLERTGERTQEAFITALERTGERRIAWQRPTGRAPTADEAAHRPARAFLTDGLFTEASIACARRADLTIVDAGTLREGTEALLDHAEVYVASRGFACALVGRDDPWAACEKIRDRGARWAAVTCGEEGWIALVDDERLQGNAWPVEAIDTTGCGDVFHAGVVEGLLAGWPPGRTLDFAAWAAARAATRLGGRAGVPDRGDYPGPR